MELYDICMLVVLAGATVFGAWKGMAWQIASAASLVVSYAVALRFSPQIAHHFGQQAPLNRFIAMFVLYVATSIAIWLAFHMVSGFINRVRLREFDRQLGALFGAAKGVLLCVAITFFAVTLSAKARTLVMQSRSGHYIALLLNRADTVMPQEFHDVLDPYLHKLEQELEHPSDAPQPATIPSGDAPSEQGSAALPWPSDNVPRSAVVAHGDRSQREFDDAIVSGPNEGPDPNIRNIIGRWAAVGPRGHSLRFAARPASRGTSG